jgi:uridine kinase
VPPVLAIAGAAGSGKSTLAAALDAPIVSLDDCYHTDPGHAPSLPRYDGPGRVVNLSDPASIDVALVRHRLDACRDADLVIVEGIFALTLDAVRAAARWTVFVDTPADISIARKTLRKIGEGRDAGLVLRGYLEHGHAAYVRHIAPARHHADLVLDGTRPTTELRAAVRQYLTTRRGTA